MYGARSDGPEYRVAKVERGNLTATVSASGTLSAVTTVQVGSQISGQIKETLADFNTPVKKGQLLARIDPESFELKVRQAEADLEAARTSTLQRQGERGAALAAGAGENHARTRSVTRAQGIAGAEGLHRLRRA